MSGYFSGKYIVMRSVYAEYYQEAIFWLSFRLLSIKDLMILLNRNLQKNKNLESGHYLNFIDGFKIFLLKVKFLFWLKFQLFCENATDQDKRLTPACVLYIVLIIEFRPRDPFAAKSSRISF